MIDKQLPSNQSFGFLFSGIFTLLSAFAWYQSEDLFVVYTWLVIAIIIGLICIVAPKLLTPFNKAWMKLGELMGKIVSPVILGIIFFVLLTPIGFLARLFGRDELRLKLTKANSYWIDRAPPGPSSDSYKNQF
jgi:hypothetical protein